MPRVPHSTSTAQATFVDCLGEATTRLRYWRMPVMTDAVSIRPVRFRQFGPTDGCTFCLVTNSALLNQFNVEEAAGYERYVAVPFDHGDSFENILDRAIPEPAHVFIV